MLSLSRQDISRIVEAFLVCLFLAAPAQISLAQTTKSTIFGTVTDATGAVVPGATVTVTALATNETRRATSGPDGS